MSHFKVLVVTKNGTEDELEKVLASFHEYDVAAEDTPYVQNVNVTEEALQKYETASCHAIRNPDGSVDLRYVDGELNEKYTQFLHRDVGGTQELILPPDYKEIRVPAKDHESFKDWVIGWYQYSVISENEEPNVSDHKKAMYGWIRVKGDEVLEVVQRTNPNAKWDWYVIGGLFTDSLRNKLGAFGDSFQKSDIDFKACNQICKAERSKTIDGLFTSNPTLNKNVDLLNKALKAHAESEVWYADNRDSLKDKKPLEIRAMLQEKFPDIKYIENSWWFVPFVDFNIHKDIYEWIEAAPIVSAHAFLDVEGNWISQCDMGWFGMSVDKMTDDEWYKRLSELVDNVEPDHWITVVDCHI